MTASQATFVGRETEIAQLVAGFDEALEGRGSLFLLAGEPGIGKTRLAEEFGRRAKERQAVVLWGRCWEAGGAPAYWPWVQAIRSLIHDTDRGVIEGFLGTGGPEIAQLVPDLHELFPGMAPPADSDSEGARFRLFDAAAEFFRRASGDRPIVLLLDDLHAADAASLLLLRFAADALAASRVLLVAGYRDTEIRRDIPLGTVLGELARTTGTRRLALRGFSRPEIARYVEASSSVAPREELVGALHEETGGNPLFVGEVVHLLATEGALEGKGTSLRFRIPEGIREAVDRRLAHLSSECRRVLTLASVLGREFGLAALGRVSDVSDDELMRLLDEAMSASVIGDVPGAIGRMRFAHALFREVLYDELTTPRRLLLHRKMGEALESLHAGALEPLLAQLAYHFFEASPGGDVAKAVRYARLAGEHAVRMLAFEEAVRAYRMALETLELEEPAGGIERCALLLALGDAQGRSGDRAAAKTSFLEAAGVARSLGRPAELAHASLGYGGRFVWDADRGDVNLVPLLEEALAAVSETEQPLRARLLARLAGGPLRDEPGRERRDALSSEAVSIAREIGDPGLLAWCLDGRYAAVWWPENVDERLSIAGELIRTATLAGDKERVFQGHHYRWVSLLERGDMPALHAEHAVQTRLADELRQPSQLAYVSACNATLATLEGRLDEAEAHAWRTHEIARRAYGSLADIWLRVQLYAIRRFQGRLDEVDDLLARSVEEFPTYGVFRCILADVHCSLGREAEARRVFDGLAGDGFVITPPEEYVYGLTLLAGTAARLGDEVAAAKLLELLRPFAGRIGVSAPDDCTGAVSGSLGVLAGALGLWEDADGFFEDALESNARIRSRPWLARTQIDYARMLADRDGPGDRERANALRDAAAEIARDLGLSGLIRQDEPVEAAGIADGVFRLDGEYWSIAFEGRHFRLKDVKGLHYLAMLLAAPGRERHALDLVVTAAGQRAPAGAPVARELEEAELTSSRPAADEVLDGKARAAYGRRLDELRAEIEEAETWRDTERAAQAREEIEFLGREVAAAVGLGGRPRGAGSPAERARQSVNKAIKVAISKIGEHHRGLGRHLEATVQTGAYCCYQPALRGAVAWRT